MMAKALRVVLALLILAGGASAAQAETSTDTGPPTISVNATGSVEFVPDVARLTLGIRIESATAQDATSRVNQQANQVIAALRSMGINDRAIKTISYNLSFRESPQPAPTTNAPLRSLETNAPVANANESVARLPLPGSYVATETLEVTTAVGQAGKALDAAIGAGANESFGLNYQSSNAASLYRAALAKAVGSARDSAKAIADAAHLTILSIQSISTNGPPAAFGGEPMMRTMGMAQVLPGTEAISATVYVVYKVR